MRASQATSVTELGNFLTKVAQNIRVIFWAISREKWFGYVLGIIGEIGQLFIPSSGHTASNGHSVSVVPRLTNGLLVVHFMYLERGKEATVLSQGTGAVSSYLLLLLQDSWAKMFMNGQWLWLIGQSSCFQRQSSAVFIQSSA